MNFFQVGCQSDTTALVFGLCDDEDGSPAYIDTTNQTEWVAKLHNTSSIEVTLTAIDNCVEMLRADGTMEVRCDAMLTYENNIVFVELKNQAKRWIPHSIEQLETTIINFIANHDITVFRRKRAFACNKKHPRFHYGNAERSQRFYSQYKIRLIVGAEIKI